MSGWNWRICRHITCQRIRLLARSTGIEIIRMGIFSAYEILRFGVGARGIFPRSRFRVKLCQPGMAKRPVNKVFILFGNR